MGWVSQLMGWVGLVRVTQNGPVGDNCGVTDRQTDGQTDTLQCDVTPAGVVATST